MLLLLLSALFAGLGGALFFFVCIFSEYIRRYIPELHPLCSFLALVYVWVVGWSACSCTTCAFDSEQGFLALFFYS